MISSASSLQHLVQHSRFSGEKKDTGRACLVRRRLRFVCAIACSLKDDAPEVDEDESLPAHGELDVNVPPVQKAKRVPWNKGLRLVPAERSSEEREKVEAVRRRRISEANKGRLPWNTGRKHSPETIRKIRERTIEAMKNPEVREKLRGFQQSLSPEVKAKISLGVHEYWMKRLGKQKIQNLCLIEWKECIAEAARKGEEGEEELQWDSYAVQLQEGREEYLRLKAEFKARMKNTPRSLEWTDEHRRKVSEAIRAKWATEEYRSKVTDALKARSLVNGVSKPPRPPGPPRPPRPRRPAKPWVTTTSVKVRRVDEKFVSAVMAGEEQYVAKKKPVNVNGVAHPKLEGRAKKTVSPPPTAPPLPTFVDSKTSEKTEKLKQLRASRLMAETKKKEAAERAKMLMAEAERAAKALEAIAFKDQFAMASLLETRKLLAEAARSIKAIESGNTSEVTGLGEAVYEQKFEEETGTVQDGDLGDQAEESTLGSSEELNIVEVDEQRETTSSDTVPTSKKKKRWHCGRLIE